jgi:hypothetical protein
MSPNSRHNTYKYFKEERLAAIRRVHETTDGWQEKQDLLESYMSSWGHWNDPPTQWLETTNVTYTAAYWIQMIKWNCIYPGPK